MSSSRRTAWWLAGGGLFVVVYGAAWAATAHTGAPTIAATLRAERPALVDIQVVSPGPFVVRASYKRDYRGDGRLVGQGWRQYLWMPGSFREVAREGPYIDAGF